MLMHLFFHKQTSLLPICAEASQIKLDAAIKSPSRIFIAQFLRFGMEDIMLENANLNRIPAHLTLTISSIFKQNNIKVDNIDAPITVTNVSEAELGLFLKAYFQKDFILMPPYS